VALGCANRQVRTPPTETPRVNPLERTVKEQAGTITDLQARLKARDGQILQLNQMLKTEQGRSLGLEKERNDLRARLAAAPKPETLDIESLKKEFGADATVSEVDGGVAVTLLGEVLFDSGQAALNAKGLAALKHAASVIRNKFPDKHIEIQGHTDSVPIKKSKYRSNWELSAERSLSVLHYLIDKEKFSASGLSVAAYADTKPVASNKSADGRRQNRRAVLVIKTK
jgi:chemotaxis protein MotB